MLYLPARSQQARKQEDFFLALYTVWCLIEFGNSVGVRLRWLSFQQSLIDVKHADWVLRNIGSMAIWLESEAEPSPTLADSLYKLGPIGEDSQTGVPSASPEPSTGHFDYFTLGDYQRPPKRSPTYPFVPLGPSKAPILKSLGKVSKVNQKHRQRRAVPPIPNRLVHTKSILTGPHRIRHSSTIDTHNSASFEDTAVWDRKAILSLGMYVPQTLSHLHNGVILASKPSQSALSSFFILLERSAWPAGARGCLPVFPRTVYPKNSESLHSLLP